MDEPKKKKGRRPSGAKIYVSPNQKMRKCLKCGEMFLSTGPDNRLCGCKGTYAGIPLPIRH